MSNKDSRSGGKFSGNHTTLTPAAAMVADIAHACPYVTRISPGYLKAGLPSVNGNKRVKIGIEGSSILVSVRDNTSHQEIHVFSGDLQASMLAIAKGIRDVGVRICFRKEL